MSVQVPSALIFDHAAYVLSMMANNCAFRSHFMLQNKPEFWI